MNLLLVSLWLLFPCYLANMAPVFGFKLFGRKTVINEKIYGKNKTWLGFLFGVIFGIIGALIQGALYNVEFFRSISIIDYSTINLFYLGYLLGFSSMFGDLIKSLIKRRLKIPSGEKFIPFDQIDYVLFSFLALSLIDFVPWNIIIVGVVVTFFLNIIVNQIGYYLSLKQTKW